MKKLNIIQTLIVYLYLSVFIVLFLIILCFVNYDKIRKNYFKYRLNNDTRISIKNYFFRNNMNNKSQNYISKNPFFTKLNQKNRLYP
jgi:hypothetical protein